MNKHPNYREPALAELRGSMKILDTLKNFPNAKFVPSSEFPSQDQRGMVRVPWLHENMIQVGRAVAHLACNTWSYDEDRSRGHQANVISHNYVLTARLIQRWKYPVTYKGEVTEYLGWNVKYLDKMTEQLTQHPMVSNLHHVAANNRKYPAKFGPSRVMSWEAVPKYVIIAAVLKGATVLFEAPPYWDYRATCTRGFQSELSVMSGEFDARLNEQATLAYEGFI